MRRCGPRLQESKCIQMKSCMRKTHTFCCVSAVSFVAKACRKTRAQQSASMSAGLTFFQLTKGGARFDKKRFGSDIELFEVRGTPTVAVRTPEL